MKMSEQAALRRAETTAVMPAAQRFALQSKALQIVNWLRRHGSELMRRPNSRRLRLVETVSLGEKRFISIVQVDGEQFLLGGSASAVTVLAKLESSRRDQQEGNQPCFAEVYSVTQQRQADRWDAAEDFAA